MSKKRCDHIPVLERKDQDTLEVCGRCKQILHRFECLNRYWASLFAKRGKPFHVTLSKSGVGHKVRCLEYQIDAWGPTPEDAFAALQKSINAELAQSAKLVKIHFGGASCES